MNNNGDDMAENLRKLYPSDKVDKGRISNSDSYISEQFKKNRRIRKWIISFKEN